MSRRGSLIFIHVFLAVQLILPLSYYLWRQDRNDERFAWRMFSYERMVNCSPQFFVGDSQRPFGLHSKFHDAWVSAAQRGRRQVVEAMAARLCKDNPNTPVKVRLVCQNTADAKDATGKRPLTELGSMHWDVCPSGRLK